MNFMNIKWSVASLWADLVSDLLGQRVKMLVCLSRADLDMQKVK